MKPLSPHTPLVKDAEWSRTAVPAARPIARFSMERIADDVVLLDAEFNRYHTLNALAFDIWRACDGVRSANDLADLVDGHRATVEAAVQQLGEARLLRATEATFQSTMHRRQLVKLASTGTVGAVAIPIAKSFTAPDAIAAQTGTCST